MSDDLFPEELKSAQSAEIDRLRSRINDLQNDCRKLNMIYKQAWDITEVVCCVGGLDLVADQNPFLSLYDSMKNYDKENDLRDKYEDLISE